MQLTLKDSNKEKARIAAKNISLKEKFRKNRALLKLAADTISDAKQRVSQFLNTTFGEIVPNSYKEALMLAYADSIEQCLELSFSSLDSALVDRVMGKIDQIKQGIEAAAEGKIDASKILSFDVPSFEIKSDSEDEGGKNDAAREEGDDHDGDDYDDNNDDDNLDGGHGSCGDRESYTETFDKNDDDTLAPEKQPSP